jgi:hypothetical protein
LDLHTYSVKWSNDFYIMIRVQWVGLILSSRMISFLFGTFFFFASLNIAMFPQDFSSYSQVYYKNKP